MKKQNDLILLLKSLLYLLLCWLAGLFINMFLPNCYKSFGVIMCYAFGFCSLGAIICIYADFCYKAGGRANTKSMRIMNEVTSTQHFGAVIGIVPTAINYLYVLLLWLSKLGVMKLDFFPYYKTLCIYFAPLVYLVAPNSIYYTAEGVIDSVPPLSTEISLGAMLLFTVLPIVFELSCWAAYYIGYNHISLKDKLLYGTGTKE